MAEHERLDQQRSPGAAARGGARSGGHHDLRAAIGNAAIGRVLGTPGVPPVGSTGAPMLDESVVGDIEPRLGGGRPLSDNTCGPSDPTERASRAVARSVTSHRGRVAAPQRGSSRPAAVSRWQDPEEEAADRRHLERLLEDLDEAGYESQEFDADVVTGLCWKELPEAPGLKPDSRRGGKQWGLCGVIDSLVAVADEFQKRHPGEIVRVLDISKERGGELEPHASHQKGIDVDVAVVLKDPTTRRRTTYKEDQFYSRERTQELITLFHTHSVLPVEVIWFADPEVETRHPEDEPRAELSSSDKSHVRHFHVRYVHPIEGRTSRRGKRTREQPTAAPIPRDYTGPTAVGWLE